MEWKLKCVQSREGAKLDKLLAEGWEPFAVTTRLQDDEPIVWLKKQE